MAILGPRQAGKTTLAHQLAASLAPSAAPVALYLDLETPTDLAQLSDPSAFFARHADRLVILDEVQRTPGLFATLRAVIDQRRRGGDAMHSSCCWVQPASIAWRNHQKALPDVLRILSWHHLFCDLMLVRRLQPWARQSGKRLVKAPKVYVRDSGIVHALLGLGGQTALLSHPVAGGSWEGWIIENVLACTPSGTQASYYRTAVGAEVDLVLELPGGEIWAVEIKRSSTPTVDKGFHIACADLAATRRLVVSSANTSFPMAGGIEHLPLLGLMRELLALRGTQHRSVATAP